MRILLPLTMLAALAAVAGCGGGDAGGGSDAATAKPAVGLPTGLVVPQLEGSPQTISATKTAAAPGDELVLEGYIGGSADPFVDGLAAFTIVDTGQVKPCDAKADDQCPQPWDFCCEPREKVTAASATVQVVDDAGVVIPAGLRGYAGLRPGGRVLVAGTVAQADNGLLVVNADAVQLTQAAPAAAPASACGSHACGGCGE